jgi:hypothetical protein
MIAAPFASHSTTKRDGENPVENPVDNRAFLWETYEISTWSDRSRIRQADSVDTTRGRVAPATSGYVGLSTIHRPYYSNHQISLLLNLKSNVKHPILKREVLS